MRGRIPEESLPEVDDVVAAADVVLPPSPEKVARV
jgi:hypothetical protein